MEWQITTGQKMKTITSIALLISLTFLITPVNAWNNHAGITYLILQDHWKENPPKKVKAESLEAFILKEKENLPAVLDGIDTFIAEKLPHCPKPAANLRLVSKNVDPKSAVPLFFKALRVNPNHKAPLYTQAVSVPASKPSALLNDITTLHEKGKLVNETFLPLTQNSLVSPTDILITAVDEPDYGLDLYLFEDSETEFGKIYGFGEQAFANPKYEYSSQAPFHMGFYHESGLIYTLAGFLKRTFPEYRIYQFTKLSEFAFKTGHPYWGYRFAGWALHYLQDLTQPYHSSVLPRIGAGKQIGVQLLATIGFPNSKVQMIDYVTLRHTLIEEYQYYLVKDIIRTNAKDHMVAKALQNKSSARSNEKIDYNSIRNLISKEAFDSANEADLQIEKLGITKYDHLYNESHPIHKILAKLLTGTSDHTRSYLNAMQVP
jgi:hypothetical protein